MKYILAIILWCTSTIVFADNTIKLVNKESFCLALNIYHEARNQSTAGNVAVAEVTMNRVKSNQFSNTVCNVVYKPYAFSWTINQHFRHTLPDLSSILDKRAWQSAVLISNFFVNGYTTAITDGALFYHSDSITPYWADCFEQTVTIDNHIFYVDNGQSGPCHRR